MNNNVSNDDFNDKIKKHIHTFPVGNLARNSGVLLSVPIVNDGTSTLIPAYFAAIRPLYARGLFG